MADRALAPISSILVALAALGLAGCGGAMGAGPPGPPAAPPPAAREPPAAPDDPAARYEASIAEAAVVSPRDELPLQPPPPDPGGTFTLVTWTTCRGNAAPGQCGSYVAGQPLDLRWDVWVTGGTEVHDRCAAFTGDVALRLQELLGLPPYTKSPPPPAEVRRFVTLSGVQAGNLFRPCPDPAITPTTCKGTAFAAKLPPNAPPNFYEWFARQALLAWQTPAAGQPPTGYPWTRLGYTYDWAKDTPSRYGASEYVIPAAASPVSVMVRAVQTTEEFCKPTPSPAAAR